METKNKLIFKVNLKYKDKPKEYLTDDEIIWLDHKENVGDSEKTYTIIAKVVSDHDHEKFDFKVEVPGVTDLVVENLYLDLSFNIGNCSFGTPGVRFEYKKNESEKVSDAFGGSMDKQIFKDVFAGQELPSMYRDHQLRGKSKRAQAARQEFCLSNYESYCFLNLTVSFTSNQRKTVMEKFLNNPSLVPRKEPLDFEISCEQETFNFHRSHLSRISSICSNVNGSSLRITDFKKETIEVFHDFVYEEKIENFEEKLDLDVLKFGYRYKIRSLCRAARAIIIKSLTKENVIDAIEVADFLKDTELFKAALTFFKNNQGEFDESPRWKKFVDENSKCALKMLNGLILKRSFLDIIRANNESLEKCMDKAVESVRKSDAKRLKMMCD